MPNWNDPTVVEDNANAFSSILVVILGLYVWEFLTTLWFEASFIIQPRRQWRIEHVSYFACRYSFLLVMIMMTALYNLTQGVNCTAFVLSSQVLGNISIGTATLNILYRAVAISRKYGRLLTIFLAIAEVGHWAILTWNTFTIHSEWASAVKKCNITLTSRPALLTLYGYTMLFDFTILLVCLTGLYKHTSKAGAVQGQFWQLLRRQGIYYFLISFTANVFPFIFTILDLNSVMNTIPTVPAACVTTIASCRAVIWLTTQVKPDNSGLSYPPDIPMTPSGGSRLKNGGRSRNLAGAASNFGLPSELFARTHQDDEGEQAMCPSSKEPPNFRTPTSPSYYGPTSVTHLTLPDENQAGASGSIASSMHHPDKSPPLFTTEGYNPYDDQGRRAMSPDSRPSTGNEDGPIHERYRRS